MAPRWVVVHTADARRGHAVTAAARDALTRATVDAHVDFVPLQDLDSCDIQPDRVIVIGGDGTLNLAANWLQTMQSQSPIAIVPAGTGNNLASGLDVPQEPSRALSLAAQGQVPRPVDAVSIHSDHDEQLMLQSAAFGFPQRSRVTTTTGDVGRHYAS